MNAIHFVIVTTDDRERQLWAAATARDDAVDRVLDAVPEGWTARLWDEPVAEAKHLLSTMAAGDVRHFKAIAR